MGLAGLPLTTLLGIFGAGSALIVVFYILKLRRRAVPVPFSRIWDSVLRDKQATELFSKLRRVLSLLLQLALLALMVLALGDPKPKEDLREGRHLVLLIDGSVPTPRSSMSSDRAELLQAISQVTASDTRADLEAGLFFGRDSLRGLPHGEVVVIGDGAYAEGLEQAQRVSLEGAEPRFVPIGKSGK